MKTSVKILIFTLISFPVVGFPDGYFPNFAEASWVFHALFLGVGLYVWCAYHADEHGMVPPRGAKTLCFLIGFIGVPYYLFGAFGFKVGGIKLLRGLAVFVFAYALYVAAFMVGVRLSYGVWPALY